MGPNGTDYPFDFIHDRVKAICADERVGYVDLLPSFASAGDPRSLWVSPFDAHPNAAGEPPRRDRDSRRFSARLAPLSIRRSVGLQAAVRRPAGLPLQKNRQRKGGSGPRPLPPEARARPAATWSARPFEKVKKPLPEFDHGTNATFDRSFTYDRSPASLLRQLPAHTKMPTVSPSCGW